MGTSKIFVDLLARTFEIEVPDDRVDDVLDRLEALLRIPVLPIEPEKLKDTFKDADLQESDEPDAEDGETDATKRRRGNGNGASRGRSYELWI